MDSPFDGLSAAKAAVRRREQRELLGRIINLAREERADLILLCGDLLDSGSCYRETGEELVRCLAQAEVPVFIAPGNHDCFTPDSPYARLRFPSNVHIFTKNTIDYVALPEFGVKVYGAAFTENRSEGLLKGFRAERSDGFFNVMCLHGDNTSPNSPYNPISLQDIENSGLDYLALGHIHKASGLMTAGKTGYSQAGCPEGRGFDETGEKTVNLVELSGAGVELSTRCVALRRYEDLEVDVTGCDPVLAVNSAIPDDTASDIYRITLTGTCASAPDLGKLSSALAEYFFSLRLIDETRPDMSLWDGLGEDSLRGLFLSRLKQRRDAAETDEERRLIDRAARWGLAAIDNREEPANYED